MLKNLLMFLVLCTTTLPLQGEECSSEVCFNTIKERCFSSIYFKLAAGPNMLTESFFRADSNFTTGYLVSGALGYRVYDNFACELEYAFRHNNHSQRFNMRSHHSSSSYRASSYMANAYYTLPINLEGPSVYVGMGAGVAHQTCPSSHLYIAYHYIPYFVGYNRISTDFAWQAMTGLSFPILKQTFSTEYRIHNANYKKSLINQSVVFSLTFDLKSIGL